MLTHLEKDWIQSHIFKLLKVIGYTIKLNVRFRDWKLSTWTFSKILSFILNKGTLTFPWQPLQFNTVQSLSHAQLLVNAWTTAWQASLSITNSRSLLKLMPLESVIASNNLILCRSLLLLPSIFPSIRVFYNESVLCIMDKILEHQLQH